MSVMVVLGRESFSLVQGRDRLTTFELGPCDQYRRVFCGVCGTALGELGSEEGAFLFAANTLGDEPGVQNMFHEFVAKKPSWLEICDDAPQFKLHLKV